MERLRSPAVSSETVSTRSGERTVSDLIYLAAGIVVLLLFAGYAALLRRA